MTRYSPDGYNQTTVDNPFSRLDALIRDMARENPDRIAVRCGEESLSYEQLWSLAKRIAVALKALPKGRIGVSTERVCAYPAMLLACTLAKRSYVPLSPQSPPFRLRYILEDAGIVTVLSAMPAGKQLDISGSPVTVTDIFALPALDETKRSAAQPRTRGRDEELYVMYTSGTTGVPKGVSITHGNLWNFLAWAGDTLQVDASDVVLASTSFGFDISAIETWLPLIRGAAIEMADSLFDKGLDLGVVTVINTVPSLLTEYLRAKALPDSVRLLCLGGEPLKEGLLDTLEAQKASCRIFNLYGPTETSVYSTFRSIGHGKDWKAGQIGYPIANTRIYIVDKDLKPLPVGKSGEIVIAGDGVASGYIGPQNQSAFFAADFENGATVYRTGDLGRFEGGELTIQGRTDRQVKLRGNRIELDELEQFLSREAHVTDVAVIKTLSPAGDEILAAYIVADQDLDLNQVRANLGEKVAASHVPSIFTQIEKMPLTASGKLDRSALPAPVSTAPSTQATVETEDSITRRMLALWSEILRVEVGVTDTFFAMGGHSLLALRLVSEIENRFGIEMTIQDFYQHPTVEGLVGYVRSQPPAQPKSFPTRQAWKDNKRIVSSSQKRLWFIDRYSGSASYNLTVRIDLPDAPMHIGVVQAAAKALMARHEILRYYFVDSDGQPEAFVLADPKVDVRYFSDMDMADLPTFLSTPFHLDQPPLFRMALCSLGGHWCLLVCIHHIISDGWSLAILKKELLAVLDAQAPTADLALPEPDYGFADYVAWRQATQDPGKHRKSLQYWAKYLRDIPVVPDFLPEIRGGKSGSQTAVARMPANMAAGIAQVCAQEKITPFAFLLSTLMVVHARFSDQGIACVGIPSVNRDPRWASDLVGFFVDSFPVVADIRDNPSLRQLLKRIHRHLVWVQNSNSASLEELISELGPQRAPGRMPLFQVMFAMDQLALAPDDQYSALAFWKTVDLDETNGPLLVQRTTVSDGVAPKFELTYSVTLAGDTGTVELAYNPYQFDERWIDFLLASWMVVTHATLNDPALRCAAVPLLAQQEKELVTAFAKAAPTVCEDDTLLSVLRFVVNSTPDKVAIRDEGTETTYRELWDETDAQACFLSKRGIAKGSVVAVMSGRSRATILAYIALLKCGAAYAPLSPDDPPDRIHHILENIGSQLVLVDQPCCVEPARTILLSELAEASGSDDSEPLPGICAGNTAYVMHTSGSTGLPKAAPIAHRAVLRLVNGLLLKGVQSPERIRIHSALTFDASVLEMWLGLLTGATLVVAPHTRYSLHELAGLLVADNIDTVFLTTPLFHQIVDEHVSDLVKVRQVLTGGDILSAEHSRRFLENGGQVLINAYGPTEAAVVTSARKVEFNDQGSAIGSPLPGTSVAVLDANRRFRPFGTVGELYIGGDAAFHGYLNAPEANENAIVSLFDDAPPFYRSGDLVRLGLDGNLTFLGRRDDQVKLRGFRIEPGEIETCLNSYPNVTASLVAVKMVGGDKRLVAYVACRKNIASEDIIAHLRTHLPSHMIPQYFSFISKFPLKSSGKIDVDKLPVIVPIKGESSKHLPPVTKTQEQVCEIFGGLLKVGTIGRNDNFFELGGHSLLATRAVAQIRRKLDVEIQLQAFFESPDVASLAKVIDQHHGNKHRQITPIVPVVRTGQMPLSYAQKRMWFLQELNPISVAYTVLCNKYYPSRLDPRHVLKALNDMVARHEILRTAFQVDEWGEPYQNVQPFRFETIRVLNFLDLYLNEGNACLDLFEKELFEKFDLGQLPLFDFTLVHLTEASSLCHLRIHHIISDGWSMDLFWAEFSELLEASILEIPAALPPLPAQYIDYAIWQRNFTTTRPYLDQLAYWASRVGTLAAPVTLPSPQPESDDFNSRTYGIILSGAKFARIEKLTHDQNVTLFMLFSAVLALVIHKYTEAEDICIGIPIANRRTIEAEKLIGLFVNTLPLRVALSPDRSFAQLLADVKTRLLEAYDNQDIPYEKIVEELKPVRDAGMNPFFEIMLSLQQAALSPRPLGTRPVDEETPSCEFVVGRRTGNAKFDLSFTLIEADQALEMWLEFRTARYHDAFIERLLRNFDTALDSILAEPRQKVRTIDILSATERDKQNAMIHGPIRPYDRTKSLIDMVEEQAERTPDNVALIGDERTYTYRELVETIHQLTRVLASDGIGRGDRVGLAVPRSLAFVLAQLGIMAAGAAYVPLDASHPVERIKFQLDDAECSLLIVDPADVDLGAQIDIPVIDTKTLFRRARKKSPNKPPTDVSGTDICYIMYTSGSSGRPKGVLTEHRGVANCVIWMQDAFQMTEQDRVLLKENCCYDASVWQTFWPLHMGASAIVVPEGLQLDADYLIDVIDTKRATVIYFVSSLLPFFIEDERFRELKSIRHVFCGGEALQTDTFHAFTAATGSLLHNWYGPTEASIGTVCWTSDPTFTGKLIPIGRPINNVSCHVVGKNGSPMPFGVPGEMVLVGISVGPGYKNRPDVTAAAFFRMESDTEPTFPEDNRAYRTGDLVRYLEDGNIQFIGRIDHQVKIFGRRIELAEIEVTLCEVEGVEDALVITDQIAGHDVIAGYIVRSDRVSLDQVKEDLAARLPRYMIPMLVEIDAIPRFNSGKIDRNSLPPLKESAGELGQVIPPADYIEETVLGLASSLLNRPNISIHDDFFELGGHSLLAIQLVGHLRRLFNVSLPLKKVLRESSFDSLCKFIRAHMAEGGEGNKRPAAVRKEWAADLRPTSFEQKRVYFEETLAGSEGQNLVMETIRLGARDDAKIIADALSEVCAEQDILRSIFHYTGGDLVSVVLKEHDARLLDATENRGSAEALYIALREKGLALGEVPPWRAALFDTPEGERELCLVLHHILWDSWSGVIFRQSFNTIYDRLKSGRTVERQKTPYSYSDYAAWQGAAYLTDEKQLEDYWVERLGDFPTAASTIGKAVLWPAKQPRATCFVHTRLSEQQVKPLRVLFARLGCSTFSGFLGLWGLALNKRSGIRDIVVASAVTQRSEHAFFDVLGLMQNTLVFRSTIDADAGMEKHIAHLQKLVTEDLAHALYPFDRLTQRLSGGSRHEDLPISSFYTFDTMKDPVASSVAGETEPVYSVGVANNRFPLHFSVTDEGGTFSITIGVPEKAPATVWSAKALLADLEELIEQLTV